MIFMLKFRSALSYLTDKNTRKVLTIFQFKLKHTHFSKICFINKSMPVTLLLKISRACNILLI